MSWDLSQGVMRGFQKGITLGSIGPSEVFEKFSVGGGVVTI